MRIALILRGISYLENYEHKYGIPKFTIDYHDTLPSIQQNIINDLREKGHIVDIYLLSYHSKYEEELINILNPVKTSFTDYKAIPLGAAQEQIGCPMLFDYHLKGIEMYLEYEQQNNLNYDTILITRFDLYYYKKITEIDLDHTCINYPFWHIAGPNKNIFSSEDNLIYFPRNKTEIIYNSINYLKNNLYESRRKILYSTHSLGEYLLKQGERIKYLFGEKGDGAYDYPIYKFGRHIFGNVKEYMLDDIIKTEMNRIYHSEEEKENPKAIYVQW